MGRIDEKEAEDREQADDALKKRLLTPESRHVSKKKRRRCAQFHVRRRARGDSHRRGDFPFVCHLANASGSQSDVYGWGLSNCNQLGVFDPNPDLQGDQQVTYFPKRIESLSDKQMRVG